MIYKEAVTKLKLPMEKHPNLSKIVWFHKGNEVPISPCCLVKFSVDNEFKDEVWCDMAPMDA